MDCCLVLYAHGAIKIWKVLFRSQECRQKRRFGRDQDLDAAPRRDNAESEWSSGPSFAR